MRNCYREYQKIDGRVRLVLLALTVLLAGILVLDDYLNLHLPDAVPLSALCLAFIYILANTFKFSTVIFAERIYISFRPFFKTTINITEITGIKIVHYQIPGFGVRYDIANAVTYYKAAGNTGLLLTLTNHKTVVIGTGRATEIKCYLEQLKLAAPPLQNE